MAISIPKSFFTEEQATTIRKSLYCAPKEKFRRRGVHTYKTKKSTSGIDVFSITSLVDQNIELINLPLYWARTQLGMSNDNIQYPRVDIKFTGTLRDEQKPIANQAIDLLNKQRTATLCSRPGFGKTTMSVAISSKIGLLTLILVRGKGMIEQWANTISARTNCSSWQVGEQDMPASFHYIICLYTRTKKIPYEIRSKVGMAIIDEAHMFCNSTGVEAMLDFSPKYVLSCTATPKKTNEMDKVTQLICGPEHVGDFGTVPFRLTKLTTPFTANRVMQADNTPNWTTLIQSILYNTERNTQILYLLRYLLQRKRKVLVFTTETDHTILLETLLRSFGFKVDSLCGDKRSYSDSDFLIGNVQKCGTGFDEEMYCEDWGGERINTIVLVSSFRDIPLLYQVIGRAFRSADPEVWHLVDSDKTLQSQWKECHKWYKVHASSIQELTLLEFAQAGFAYMSYNNSGSSSSSNSLGPIILED